MTTRPFRHLCPEADRRDAMTDAEFWEHVGRSLAGDELNPEEYEDAARSPGGFATDTLCPECGEAGACAWDANGRPLIHAISDDSTEASP